MQPPSISHRYPLYSIALLSATALSYEILLTRLFSIIQYHHFAYMIISLALLGYGVSGTLLTLFRERIQQNYNVFYIGNILLFAISTLICFLATQSLAFNAEQMLWDYSQSLRLFASYLLLMLPFLFAANAIGLSLMNFGERIGSLYGADLLGAGIGSIAIIGLLFLLLPNQVLPMIAALGLLASLIACFELRCCQSKLIIPIVISIVLLMLIPAQWTALEISPYKGLPQLLRVQDTKIVDTRSSPLGLIQVVESPSLPLRYAPGLSLNATTEPPAQLAVFVDGDGPSAITSRVEDVERLAYLDQQTSAAVFHLIEPESVLILGAGTGNDVLQARYHKPTSIDAVELNPQVVELVSDKFSDYTGKLFQQPGINIYFDDARGFISKTDRKFDVIQLSLVDSHGASSSGLYALSENYLYTVEAIKQYLSHLQPGGILSITRWMQLPPRDSLKLVATAIEALKQSGSTQIEQQLLLIRSWQTTTLLIKNTPVTPQEITKLQTFCKTLSFDTAYFPGTKASDPNQLNILREPYLYQATKELLGDNPQDFLKQYKFKITPATDNQPYFSNFFKWQLLPEILSLRESGGMPLMEWGYVILIATLAQAMIASLLLILLPLFSHKSRISDNNSPVVSNLLYFTALGLAFLFIEIAFMQKFTLYLHHPLYSIAVTLAAFLLFAGWGSTTSKQWQQKWGYIKTLKIAVSGIVLCGLVYIVLLDSLFTLTMGIPALLKIMITGLLIAPLAFCMGIPFPLALSFLNQHYSKLIPWAWGVNGCASVISAILAMLLAIHLGFNAVILCALLLYGCAWLVFSTIEKTVIST